VPLRLSRTIFYYVGSPYSQNINFFLFGIVLTVRFSKVSWIFFFDDYLNDFFAVDIRELSERLLA
jgi:hypothetical protein